MFTFIQPRSLSVSLAARIAVTVLDTRGLIGDQFTNLARQDTRPSVSTASSEM